MKLLINNNLVLLEKAVLVKNILDEEIQSIIKDLITLSMEIGGLGLAAPQVGISKQIFVYRKYVASDKYKVVINPKILVASGKMNSKDEGCLSYPGFRIDIKRAKIFIITGFDQSNNPIRIKASNANESKILQHEYDHLMGITIKTRRLYVNFT